jgi:hypothetical protein
MARRARRIGCHRAREAHRRAPPSRIHVEARIPQGSGPFCFSRSPRGCTSAGHGPAPACHGKPDRSLTSCLEGTLHPHAVVPSNFSDDISWRVCFGTTVMQAPNEVQGRPGCAPRGRPRRAASQRFGGRPPSRWSTTAMRFILKERRADPWFLDPLGGRAGRSPDLGALVLKPSSSSRFEGGNRPQRLGGTGTRHRNLLGV